MVYKDVWSCLAVDGDSVRLCWMTTSLVLSTFSCRKLSVGSWVLIGCNRVIVFEDLMNLWISRFTFSCLAPEQQLETTHSLWDQDLLRLTVFLSVCLSVCLKACGFIKTDGVTKINDMLNGLSMEMLLYAHRNINMDYSLSGDVAVTSNSLEVPFKVRIKPLILILSRSCYL